MAKMLATQVLTTTAGVWLSSIPSSLTLPSTKKTLPYPRVVCVPCSQDGPTEEAVAALKAIVTQLNERIINLQREAAGEREALAARPREAWGQGGAQAGGGGIQQYVVPPR